VVTETILRAIGQSFQKQVDPFGPTTTLGSEVIDYSTAVTDEIVALRTVAARPDPVRVLDDNLIAMHASVGCRLKSLPLSEPFQQRKAMAATRFFFSKTRAFAVVDLDIAGKTALVFHIHIRPLPIKSVSEGGSLNTLGTFLIPPTHIVSNGTKNCFCGAGA
jgi:hypothetical protein